MYVYLYRMLYSTSLSSTLYLNPILSYLYPLYSLYSLNSVLDSTQKIIWTRYIIMTGWE